MDFTPNQKTFWSGFADTAIDALKKFKDMVLASPEPTVPAPAPTPIPEPTPTPIPTPVPAPASKLTALWANDGGEKIPQDDIGKATLSKVWDGTKMLARAARNEVVGFQVIAEAGTEAVTAAPPIVSPGALMPVDVFVTRYVPIKGLSKLSYETYDERHVPKKFRRPHDSNGIALTGTKWTDRPDHDKFYPDPLVPAFAVPSVTIPAGKSQSFWVDIYVPKNTPAGAYGLLLLFENRTIPISITVTALTLPDVPHAKTMLHLGIDNLLIRYGINDRALRDAHHRLAHVHKIAMVDADTAGTAPTAEWADRLTGKTFTDIGPGQNTATDVFSIGQYGSWAWSKTQAAMVAAATAWENWFKANAPGVARFLYLIDESSDYTSQQTWANWLKPTGLQTMSSIPLPSRAQVPALSLSASWRSVMPASWGTEAAKYPPGSVWFYNGKRPASPSFATEDDGVALRVLPWLQIKMGLGRWYFWHANYYRDYQGGRPIPDTDVFKTAATFSGPYTQDPVVGETGYNHSNGDGLLMYPGTDKIYPASSLGLTSPLPSYRLKMWRRGIQDMDYYALAAAKDLAAAKAVLAKAVPKALWEYGVTDANDPTWTRTDISWSTRPDDWENFRLELETIALR